MEEKRKTMAETVVFSLVDRGMYLLEIVFALVSGALLLFVMLSTALDVALRQVNNSGIRGVVDVNGVLIVPIIFLSLAYAQRMGRHVSMSVLVDRVPGWVAGALKRFGLLIGFATIAWMGIESVQSFESSFASNESSFSAIRLVLWPFRLSVVIGLFAWAIELALQFVRGRPQEIHSDT